jgi:hypothetical protein
LVSLILAGSFPILLYSVYLMPWDEFYSSVTD